MKCIDAIESVLQGVLAGFCERFALGELSDLELAQNARVVVDQAMDFLEKNRELGVPGSILADVLFQTVLTGWRDILKTRRAMDFLEDGEDPEFREPEYDDFYFEFLFKHGVYPD